MNGRIVKLARGAADIILIIFAFIVMWQVYGEMTKPSALNVPIKPLYHPGDVLHLPDSTEWLDPRYERNVVIIAKDRCQACNDSKSFYVRLAERIHTSDRIRLLLANDKPETLMEAMASLRVDRSDFFQWNGSQMETYPTIFITDNQGHITNMFSGKLKESGEDTIFALLDDPSVRDARSSSYNVAPIEVERSAVRTVLENEEVELISPVDRNMFHGSDLGRVTNVPLSEFSTRVPAEFPKTKTFVVDCTGFLYQRCQIAGGSLKALGAETVYLVPDGSKP